MSTVPINARFFRPAFASGVSSRPAISATMRIVPPNESDAYFSSSTRETEGWLPLLCAQCTSSASRPSHPAYVHLMESLASSTGKRTISLMSPPQVKSGPDTRRPGSIYRVKQTDAGSNRADVRQEDQSADARYALHN